MAASHDKLDVMVKFENRGSTVLNIVSDFTQTISRYQISETLLVVCAYNEKTFNNPLDKDNKSN